MILAMMRLKWSVRAKVIIARGGGGSEDFGEDHMFPGGTEWITNNLLPMRRGGKGRVFKNITEPYGMGRSGKFYLSHSKSSDIPSPPLEI